MIIDKEYPATHSMSTAWYVVDDEGNVGIMKYEDNGPIPWGTEETTIEDLVHGYVYDLIKGPNYYFNLKPEQVLGLYDGPFDPRMEKHWYSCAVKIDMTRRDRFLELLRRPEFGNRPPLCLSDELGLYDFEPFFQVYGCEKEKAAQMVVDQMIADGLILEVYRLKDFYIYDGEVKGDYDSVPYYIFQQPYGMENLPEKINSPVSSVKIDQVPKGFRHMIPRIPGSFREMESFQIAQHTPCDSYGTDEPDYLVNDCLYQACPLENGGMAYMLKDLYHFCSDGCLEYGGGQPTTSRPTVLVLGIDLNGTYGIRFSTDRVLRAANIVSVYPSVKSSGEEARNGVGRSVVDRALSFVGKVLEDSRPYVILVMDKAMTAVCNIFNVTDGKISIGGYEYPLFPLSELDMNREEIERLAFSPYRGKEHELVVSENRMKELVEEGSAIEFTYTW